MGLQGDLKPSRSEAGEILSQEDQAKYAKQVEEFLKKTTPVRTLKPSRSDLDDNALLNVDSSEPQDSCKAEVERFKELESDGELLKTDGGTVNDDSYVETLYYDDLNAVDKSMHYQDVPTESRVHRSDRKLGAYGNLRLATLLHNDQVFPSTPLSWDCPLL